MKPVRGKYESHVEPRIDEVRAWARDGRTDAEISEALGISTPSFYSYKSAHPEFAAALKVSKDIADNSVIDSLYKRANGFTIRAVKPMIVAGQVELVEYDEYYPPDPTSMIFWLKNRRPKEWRDKHDHTIEGDLQYKIIKPANFPGVLPPQTVAEKSPVPPPTPEALSDDGEN